MSTIINFVRSTRIVKTKDGRFWKVGIFGKFYVERIEKYKNIRKILRLHADNALHDDDFCLKLQIDVRRKKCTYTFIIIIIIFLIGTSFIYSLRTYFRHIMHKNDAFSRSARKKSLQQHYNIIVDVLYAIRSSGRV